MSTTPQDPAPQESFFEALIGSLSRAQDEAEEDARAQALEATAAVGETVQGIISIALGARAKALEAGVAKESADVIAMSTYATLLGAAFQ